MQLEFDGSRIPAQGDVFFNIKYKLKQADGILPAGSQVAYDQLVIAEAELKDAFAESKKTIALDLSSAKTIVKGENFEYQFDESTRLEFSQETQYLRWSNDSLCVIFDHWVFLHMEFSSCSYAYRDLPWECYMDNFPKDVTADVPFPGGSNQFNPSVNGMSEAHIENGVFTCQERELGFESTGYDPFIFAYLVRDNE